MTLLAEFDAEPELRNHRLLFLLLLLSAIAHSLSLSSLRWSPESKALAIPLSVSIAKPDVPTPTRSNEIASDGQEHLDPLAAALPNNAPDRHEPAQPEISAAPQPKPSQLELSMSWSNPACNPQQKRTAGRLCEPETDSADYASANRYRPHFENLFTEEQSVIASRASDLKAIDRLLERQATINQAISNFDKPPAHLLAERQRVSAEISRIDRKYASVDLLKVLNSAYKTTKKLVSSK